MPDPIVKPFVLTYYINYKEGGFSERHYLKAVNYTEALQKGKEICMWRMAIAAAGATMVHARVGRIGSPRDRKRCIDGPVKSLKPLDGQNAVVPLHSKDSAVHYTFETLGGQWNNRLIRAIPDTWIEDEETKADKIPIKQAEVLPALEAATTDILLFGGLLKVIVDNTLHAVKNPLNPDEYVTTDWEKCILVGVSSRDTGRPFGGSRGRARTHS